MVSQLKAEQEHQKRAFEVYYAQGGQRTYAKVAAELGVSVSAVKLWSRTWTWPQRIAERDAAAARQLADQSLQSTVDELGRNKKIVQMALIKVAKAINSDKVRVQIGDLDRLIRLQSYLDGYVEGQTWEDLSPEELAQRFLHVMYGTNQDFFDRFYAEYKRLKPETSSSRPGDRPPALGPPSSLPPPAVPKV